LTFTGGHSFARWRTTISADTRDKAAKEARNQGGLTVKRMRSVGEETDRKVCRSHLAKRDGTDTITEPTFRSVSRPTIHRQSTDAPVSVAEKSSTKKMGECGARLKSSAVSN
jgi:hypothetical protein